MSRSISRARPSRSERTRVFYAAPRASLLPLPHSFLCPHTCSGDPSAAQPRQQPGVRRCFRVRCRANETQFTSGLALLTLPGPRPRPTSPQWVPFLVSADHAHARAHAHTNTQTSAHTRTHTHTQKHTHTHTHTHTHIRATQSTDAFFTLLTTNIWATMSDKYFCST